MFGLFKIKPLLSDEDREFQIATFKWLLKNFGGDDFYNETQLVLPTRKFFPSLVENEQQVAEETFASVKKLACMDNWPCELVRQEDDVNPIVAPTIALQDVPGSPLGTFGIEEDNTVYITYNPQLANDPMRMVATFAHELAHYLTAASKEEPPGGWENWEFATDIAATFMGFGIFMANSSTNFQQYTNVDSQGWTYNRSGYLSDEEHVFALAIFIMLRGFSVEEALPHLKTNLRKLLKRAVSEIESLDVLIDIKNFEKGMHNSK